MDERTKVLGWAEVLKVMSTRMIRKYFVGELMDHDMIISLPCGRPVSQELHSQPWATSLQLLTHRKMTRSYILVPMPLIP